MTSINGRLGWCWIAFEIVLFGATALAVHKRWRRWVRAFDTWGLLSPLALFTALPLTLTSLVSRIPEARNNGAILLSEIFTLVSNGGLVLMLVTSIAAWRWAFTRDNLARQTRSAHGHPYYVAFFVATPICAIASSMNHFSISLFECIQQMRMDEDAACFVKCLRELDRAGYLVVMWSVVVLGIVLMRLKRFVPRQPRPSGMILSVAVAACGAAVWLSFTECRLVLSGGARNSGAVVRNGPANL